MQCPDISVLPGHDCGYMLGIVCMLATGTDAFIVTTSPMGQVCAKTGKVIAAGAASIVAISAAG
jgi:hypothetical protein